MYLRIPGMFVITLLSKNKVYKEHFTFFFFSLVNKTALSKLGSC